MQNLKIKNLCYGFFRPKIFLFKGFPDAAGLYMMKTGVFLIGILMVCGCGVSGLRYQQSGLNTTFDFGNDTSFDQYVSTTRSMVEKARVDLNKKNRELIVEANTPFELRPENQSRKIKNGVLLIHGLSDSPYQMRDLARHFQSKGFLVRTILLPGHGTVPGDMLDVTYQEWIKAAEYGYKSFEGVVDNLYIGGFSTGGELAIYLSLKGFNIKGLFLFAPVTKIKTEFAWVSTTFAAPDWLLKQKEKDFARYESLASNAVAQVYKLTGEVNRLVTERKKLDIPTFVALSEDDITVDSESTVSLFKQYFISGENRMIVYTSEPEKYQKEVSEKIWYRDSRIPEERIVSFSHLSILVSPDDPHYGKNAEWTYSPHKWLRQDPTGVKKTNVFFGELMGKFKRKHYIQRLTYNPYFHEMTDAIDRFIESTSAGHP